MKLSLFVYTFLNHSVIHHWYIQQTVWNDNIILTTHEFNFLLFRNRLHVHSSQAIFVTVAGRNLPTLTLTMSEIYTSYMDEDGFLYVNYASEEMFGWKAKQVRLGVVCGEERKLFIGHLFRFSLIESVLWIINPLVKSIAIQCSLFCYLLGDFIFSCEFVLTISPVMK